MQIKLLSNVHEILEGPHFCSFGHTIFPVEEICYTEEQSDWPIATQVIQCIQKSHVGTTNLKIFFLKEEKSKKKPLDPIFEH